MTVEYLPVGIKCNLKCTYCYQEPMREAGNFSAPINFVKVKEAIKRTGTDFTLFGGEALLAPIEHLEEMWQFGFEKFGKNGVQTNGTLITKKHIELFKKYKVHVGISLDGPEELNRARCGTHDTDKIMANIRDLVSKGVSVSLIVTIHRLNAIFMMQLLEFFDTMGKLGIRWINLHNLEIDNSETSGNLALTDDENFLAFKTIYDDSRDSEIRFAPFEDIKNLLTHNQPSVSCIWSGCDPLSTPAVHGINSEGSLVNCGRTNKSGIDYLKSDDHSRERYLSLAFTPQEYGGCKDCKFFFACKGQCPGTAIDGDWRNRTKDCSFWFQLIDYIEQDLISQGIETLDKETANRNFIDSITRPSAPQPQHGDAPHGDYHADHTDGSSR